jgi:hypothetical protein
MAMDRPLLVGVMHVPDQFSLRAIRQLRQRMALFCNTEGFGLLEILEVRGSAVRDTPTYDYLAELGDRVEIEAILLHGPVHRIRVQHLADRIRARILDLPATFQPTRTAGEHQGRRGIDRRGPSLDGRAAAHGQEVAGTSRRPLPSTYPEP